MTNFSVEKRYGCQNNRQKERFKCDQSCGYKMEDGKCGKLTDYELTDYDKEPK
jgi:hypothetical protein